MCMGNEILEPQDALDLPQYRLVDMFMSSSHPTVKEEILQCFTSASAPLRIVICTIAFGMGVNPPDVRRIIHFGPPHSIVDYIQGIGRCGRDGKEAYASLLWGKGVSDITLRMKWQCIATIVRVANEMYYLIVTPITLLM